MKQIDSGHALWLLLFRSWKKILAVTILCISVTTTLILLVIPPKYEAATELVVRTKVENTRDGVQSSLNANLLTITTYKDMINGQMVQDEVRSQLARQDQIHLSTEKLKSSITVVQVPDSQFFKIKASARDPKYAAKIANLTARTFKNKADDILSINQVSIVSEAAVPTKTTSPGLWLSIAGGGLLGLGLGCLLALRFPTQASRQHNTVTPIKESRDCHDPKHPKTRRHH